MSAQKYELKIHVVEAQNLKAADLGGTSDPYVQLRIISMSPTKETVVKTKAILKTTSPRWDERVGPLHPTDIKDDKLEVKVYDHNAISTDELIGVVEISVAAVAAAPGGHVDDWWELHNPSNKTMKGQGTIHLRLNFLVDGKPPNVGSTTVVFVAPVSQPPQQQQYAPPPMYTPPGGWQQPQPPPPPQQQQQMPMQMPMQPAFDSRPPCQYGMACYRKNPQHFQEYSHPPGHPGSGAH